MQRTTRNQSKNQPMRLVSFDTHKHIKELQECGFDEKQAEVLVRSLLEARDYDLSTLASKEQILILQRDIAEIKQEIDAMKQDVNSIKQDITVFKNEIEIKLEKFPTKEQVLVLQNDVELVKKDVEVMKRDIVTLDKKIDDRFTILDNKIDDRFTTLDKKIDTTTKMLQETIKASAYEVRSDMARYLISMFIMLALGIAGILVKVW